MEAPSKRRMRKFRHTLSEAKRKINDGFREFTEAYDQLDTLMEPEEDDE